MTFAALIKNLDAILHKERSSGEKGINFCEAAAAALYLIGKRDLRRIGRRPTQHRCCLG